MNQSQHVQSQRMAMQKPKKRMILASEKLQNFVLTHNQLRRIRYRGKATHLCQIKTETSHDRRALLRLGEMAIVADLRGFGTDRLL